MEQQRRISKKFGLENLWVFNRQDFINNKEYDLKELLKSNRYSKLWLEERDNLL
jgi:hypothetical protein